MPEHFQNRYRGYSSTILTYLAASNISTFATGTHKSIQRLRNRFTDPHPKAIIMDQKESIDRKGTTYGSD
jgi:hypothetical protein